MRDMPASPLVPLANVPVWDDGRWESLPTLDHDVSCGTCVVGLGGTGLTAVGELLARGEDVVGLDATDVGAGAAGRNGGFLLAGAYDFYHDAVRVHGRARALGIYNATLAEMERIRLATPDFTRFVGSRRIAADATEILDCREQLRVMRADDLAVEWYEGPDGVGLTLPSDAAFNPLARCRALAQAARAGGARLFGHSAVTDIQPGRITTERGSVRCQRIIVAVDGRLEVLLPELGTRVRTARLQMLATEPTIERSVPCPMYYREGFEYWQQLPNGSIALGGFRDRAGASEWTASTHPTGEVQQLLERFLRDHLGVQAPITHRWAASAGYSRDGLPVAGEIRERVWAVGGYSGTGNVIGALCGRAIVELALDGNASALRLLVPNADQSR